VKNREKNSNEPLDKKTFKKKYIVRKYEEREREQEIKEYIDDEAQPPNQDRTDGTI
jgi:hypothetical protein